MGRRTEFGIADRRQPERDLDSYKRAIKLSTQGRNPGEGAPHPRSSARVNSSPTHSRKMQNSATASPPLHPQVIENSSLGLIIDRRDSTRIYCARCGKLYFLKLPFAVRPEALCLMLTEYTYGPIRLIVTCPANARPLLSIFDCPSRVVSTCFSP